MSEGIAVALIGAGATTTAAFLGLLAAVMSLRRSNDRGHGDVREELRALRRELGRRLSAVELAVTGVRTDVDTLVIGDARRHEENVQRLEHLEAQIGGTDAEGP